jgi:multiple sugar transport system substrate-binding protein
MPMAFLLGERTASFRSRCPPRRASAQPAHWNRRHLRAPPLVKLARRAPRPPDQRWRNRALAIALLVELLASGASAAQSPTDRPMVAADPEPGLAKPGAIHPQRISVWTHSVSSTYEFVPLRESVEQFNQSQSAYRVELYPSIYRVYEERVQSGAASGILPCLLELDGPFLAGWVWSGYLQPLDRFVSPALLKDLLPSVVAQGTYDGHLYSLGQFDSGLALWGNARHLRAAGVRVPTVKAPWSLAEFEQVLSRLTALPDVDYALNLALYDHNSEFLSYAFAPIVQGFGGDLIDRRTFGSAHGVLDGPGAVAAMQHLQQWLRSGWTRDVVDRTTDFEEGKAALSWVGHWKYVAYKEALGKDLVLLPLPDFGHGVKTGLGSWSWGVTSTCQSPGGAWAFLSYLLSPEQVLRKTAVNGAVPSRRSVIARSPLYSTVGPLRIYAQQLAAGFGVPRPQTPGYGAIRQAFSEAVRRIIAGGDPQAELTRAAARIDEDITQHRGYPRN